MVAHGDDGRRAELAPGHDRSWRALDVLGVNQQCIDRIWIIDRAGRSHNCLGEVRPEMLIAVIVLNEWSIWRPVVGAYGWNAQDILGARVGRHDGGFTSGIPARHDRSDGVAAVEQRARQGVRAPARAATARWENIARQQNADSLAHACAVIANPCCASAYSIPLCRLLSVTRRPRSSPSCTSVCATSALMPTNTTCEPSRLAARAVCMR